MVIYTICLLKNECTTPIKRGMQKRTYLESTLWGWSPQPYWPPPPPKDNLRGTNCCAGTSPALAKAAGCCNCGWSDCAVCDDDVSSSTPALCTAIWISSLVSPETNNTHALCPEHKHYLSFTICNSLNANQVLQSHLKATHIHKVHWEKGWN